MGGVLVDNFAFQKALQWTGIGMLIASFLFLALCGYIPDRMKNRKHEQAGYIDIDDGEKSHYISLPLEN